MNRWYLSGTQKFLQAMLDWVTRLQDKSPRQQASSLLARQVHIPTPIVTVGSALILFMLLLPQVGLMLPRLLVLAGIIGALTLFFVLYIRFDLPQFVNDDEAVFLTGLCLILGVGMIEACEHFLPISYMYGIPIGAIAILVTLLLHIRLAFLLSVVLSIFCGVIYNLSFKRIFDSIFL